MDRVVFVIRYWRRLFRNHVGDINLFVLEKYGFFPNGDFPKHHPIIWNFFNRLYSVDNNIEYYIRNGHSYSGSD